jgi:DsbC/DsbD-like thiol-disulfide interchange protein
MARRALHRLTVAVGLLALLGAVTGTSNRTEAQAPKSESKVKIKTALEKSNTPGVDTVVVQIAIDKGWHIYANPVDNEGLAKAATLVTVPKAKPDDVKVEYPAGKVVKDKDLGDYKVYEDKVEIKVHVKRAAGDTGKLQLNVKLMACNDKTCLPSATIMVTAP